jgi:hypothetical protein
VFLTVKAKFKVNSITQREHWDNLQLATCNMIEINLYAPRQSQLQHSIPFMIDWNELTVDELMQVCKHQLINVKNQIISKAALLIYIIRNRAKLQKQKLPNHFEQMIDAEDISINGYPLLDFIYEENRLYRQLIKRINLPVNLFGFKLPFRGWGLYGPQSGFDNLTCGEFEDAEMFFNKFHEEPGIESLAYLAAILWRPKNTPYIRFHAKTRKYKTYNAEKRVKQFLKLPPWQLYACFVWYAGCRSLLPKAFPAVYEPDNDAPDIQSVNPFTDCIHSAAGPKNGTRNEVRMTPVKELFYEMNLEALKAKELKNKS